MLNANTVSDVLVKTLVSVGVKRVYGIVGDSLNGITDSLQRHKEIQWIHTRHEESASFAAGADAQLTGELAVCAGSCGPGNLHLINGLYDSHRSNAPVLAIAAQIPTEEIGGSYFQETDPKALFKECSYFCETIYNAEQMPRLLAIAIQTALTKRGVSVLIISGDVALQKAVFTSIPTALRQAKPIVIPNSTELQQIAELLNDSERITVFAGAGCAEAHDEVINLCHTLQAPVVHTLRGKEYLEPNNPFDVGMTGFIGFSSGYYAMEDCDTLLLLGTSFPYRQFYPTHAKIIQIDLRGEQLGKRCALTMGAVGDIKNTLLSLMPHLNQKTNKNHLNTALKHYKKARLELDALAISKAEKGPLHPQFIAKSISETATPDAIVSCDVGTPTVWAARYLKMNGQRRLLGSFNHGSMANALSQAIGAQTAYPDRQVIAFCGDGGFSMLMGDFLTIMQNKLPIKVVIFNNSKLGFVDLEMKALGFLSFGTDLVNPNFATVATAMGALGIRVEDPENLAMALQQAFQHPGPALIDVVTDSNDLIIPPEITAKQIQGFGVYMIKAIINGRGNEVLNIAKSNLWR